MAVTWILITGSREWTDRDLLYSKLDAERGTVFLVFGDARGADRMAREWCDSRHVGYAQFDATWNLRGKSAGHQRNGSMVGTQPDKCIAFFWRGADNKGTAGCVKKAKDASIPVDDIWGGEAPEAENDQVAGDRDG